MVARLPYIIGFIIAAPFAWKFAKRAFGAAAVSMIITVAIVMLALAFIIVPLTTRGAVRHG